MDNAVGNLTDTQKKCLEKLKENLEDLNLSDYTDIHFIKFLKAKNFNVKETEKIFRENYYNRITFGINTIVETYEKPEVAKKYETFGTLGFAKDGSVINYAAAGRLDFYGFIMSMTAHDLCLYFSYIIECNIKMLEEENLRTGRDVREITFVMDLDGFTIQKVMHKCVIEMGLDFTCLLQDCYPEIWSQVLIVNAPSVFQKAFSIFKPVLRSNALERIHVVNRENTKETLLKYIDEDIIPVFLGGTRVDSFGDPECREFLKFGGNVPESMYRHNRVPLLDVTDPGVECHVIGPRNSYNLCLAVEDPNGRWVRSEIRTENGSTSLTVLHRDFEDGEDPKDPNFPTEYETICEGSETCKFKAISVTLRLQSHCCQIDNFTFLPFPGVYVLRLSNQGSWFTSRKLFARSTLMPVDFKF